MVNMNNFDPSKLDPKLLMEISQLVQQLPPEKLSRMQSIMHNMMAGFDVRKEMEEFEQSLPPHFRVKMATLFAANADKLGNLAGQAQDIETTAEHLPSADEVTSEAQPTTELSMREARLTILRAVADGRMPPEEAERLLFQH